MNKNINWINAVRAICIISVFFVHSENYYYYSIGALNNYIYPFYVNAFFFISGYLLFRKQLSPSIIDEKRAEYLSGGGGTLITNSFFRIVIPSILFSVIEYIPKKIIRSNDIDINDLLWETIGGRTYWFTSALVVAQIILLLMFTSRCRKIWIYWLLSLFLMIVSWYMSVNNINFLGLPKDLWQFKHGILAIGFITAGGLYWKYEELLKTLMSKPIVIVMLICYLTIFYIYSDKIHVLVSLLDVNWTGYIAGCFASILLIEISKYLPVIKLLSFIGQNSISFYFMSGALPITLSVLLNRMIGAPTLFGLIVVWLMSLIIAFMVSLFINKYIPWVFDIRRCKKV